jgi:hypothetical protein
MVCDEVLAIHEETKRFMIGIGKFVSCNCEVCEAARKIKGK